MATLTKTISTNRSDPTRTARVGPNRVPAASEVAIITGGFDRPYALGLTMALVLRGVHLDVIGSDDIDRPEMRNTPGLRFLNLQRNPRKNASSAQRALRVLLYYARLIFYVSTTKARLFHILWNNKFELFDRTLLMLYYKLLGKRIVLTAHNVNTGKRDANDSFLNRLTLKLQYHLVDHIFVHTDKMKSDLIRSFGVHEHVVTVIPFGINDSVPKTTLTRTEARRRMGITQKERVLLFFGNIGPYKGLEFLVEAFRRIVRCADYRLIIVGKTRGGCDSYLHEVKQAINSDAMKEHVVLKVEYVPDDDVESYFKLADVLVLPYTRVYQSGVLFLGYSFGLPVIATDIGSFRDDIMEGETGFLCKPCDPNDLAKTIEKYFESDLYCHLERRRRDIRAYVLATNSWDIVSKITCNTYKTVLGGQVSWTL